MPTPICQACGQTKKWIPPGTSQRTGQPYNGFWACPNKCRPQQANPPQNSPTGNFRPNLTPSKTDWDKISKGKCKFGFLLELLKMGKTLIEAEPEAEKWAEASMRELKKEYTPTGFSNEEPPLSEEEMANIN